MNIEQLSLKGLNAPEPRPHKFCSTYGLPCPHAGANCEKACTRLAAVRRDADPRKPLSAPPLRPIDEASADV